MTALREVFARFTTRFDGQALRRGDSQVQGLTGRLNAGVGAIRGIGAAFAGLAIVQTLRSWSAATQQFVSELAAVGDELDKTSRVIGISTQGLQSWRHAANLSGVGAEEFSQGLIRLQANMRQATITPTSSAARAFTRLGVSIRDSNGNLRDADAILTDMADPLHALQSDSERVAILTALMGRSGARIGPLFAEGRAGVEAMRGELEALGGGASQEMIDASVRLTDSMARLDLAMLSIKSRLASFLLPIIDSGVQAFTDFNAMLSRNEHLALGLQIALGGLAVLVGVLLVGALIAAVVTLWPFILAALAAAAAAIALYLVIQDLIVWFEGGNSVIGSFIESLLALAGLSLEDVREQWNDLIGDIQRGYNAVAEVLGLPTITLGGAKRGGRSGENRQNQIRNNVGPKVVGEAQVARQTEGQLFLDRLMRSGESARRANVDRPRTQAELRAARERASQTVNQTNQVTVNGAGGSPEEIARALGRVLDRSNREAVEALGQ